MSHRFLRYKGKFQVILVMKIKIRIKNKIKCNQQQNPEILDFILKEYRKINYIVRD